MPLILEAKFLSVEHRNGDFVPRGESANIAYDFHQALFLDGQTVRKVRLPKGCTELPFAGYTDVSVPIRLSDDGTRMYFGNDDYAQIMHAANGELRSA